ncbi:LysR family transcriptional regulator [Asanoa sp. WMMD1127]|uniref:LysR family transcriptional regulator n=1 Tax=Asanoa sp. WMMD1127 TaxID=3016107 RepID=UPI0024167238|nr:LysR family transcriptional regulator [Asanoa sp. WMMD1127]MDG4820402.1 LysR family transcriptional regulator [Asanoa sp. WMMD1127]
MSKQRPKPLDEWDFRAFIALAEERSYEDAARRMADLHGGYSRQSVQHRISKVESYVGEPLVRRNVDRRYLLTPAGERVLQIARQVVALHERIGAAAAEPTVWTLACGPHHTQFIALAEQQLRAAEESDKIRVEYLSQHNRAEHQFFGDPVDRLLRNEFHLIIGPPVRRPGLRSTLLYEARLEAMIDRDYPYDRLPLADLVRDYAAFLQPRDVRARRVLEDAITAAGIPDPDPAARVAMETYETATSVIRLRSERHRHRQGGRERARVLVVPSDVALPYKEGMVFGGGDADRFRWVPIDAGTVPLRLETCVTVRDAHQAALRPVIEALRAGVRALERGAHRISGARLPSATPIPTQRT